jgi:hypothetical protein
MYGILFTSHPTPFLAWVNLDAWPLDLGVAKVTGTRIEQPSRGVGMLALCKLATIPGIHKQLDGVTERIKVPPKIPLVDELFIAYDRFFLACRSYRVPEVYKPSSIDSNS